VGSVIVGSPRVRPYLDAAALAGVLGLLVVTIGRAATSVPSPDGWLALCFLVLVVCAFGQVRVRIADRIAWRSGAGTVLGVLAMIVVLGFEIASFSGPLAQIRAVGVVLLFSAAHVLCFLVDRPPLGRIVGWAAILCASLAVVASQATGTLDAIELGTVPVALALACTGGLTLVLQPTARTWPWLAPAAGILLLPSLIATASDPSVWRLVALGVVAVAIIITSAILRLQAPFLIATVIVMIHAIATFAPQIRAVYESVEWWLWFVPLGIIVVVFAARFERSVVRMRSVAMRIRALR
jgi:hypothetical protein